MIKRRSNELKKIDEAIKLNNARAAKAALENWIKAQNAKGADWHKSVRNQKGAVQSLYNNLGILGAAVGYKNIGEEMDDKLAKVEIKRAHRLAASKMFTGKKVKFKDSFWGISRNKCKENASKMERAKNAAGNAARTTAGVGGNVAANAAEARSIATNLRTAINSILGNAISEPTKNALVEQVFGTGLAQFVADATPFFGVVSSGVGATQAWVGVAMKLSSARKMESHYGDVRPGDAAAALDAIVSIIDKQIRKQTADGVIRTTAFSAKGISLLADGGTASTAALGAIESIAILLNTLADLVIDASQRDAGNKLISEGKIDVQLFEKCPILGCYYIVMQEHSTIMNFEVANMGKNNWSLEAERLRNAIEPVLKKAANLIKDSRLEIPGMELSKGVYQSSLKQKIYLYYKSKGYGQNSEVDVIDLVAQGKL